MRAPAGHYLVPQSLSQRMAKLSSLWMDNPPDDQPGTDYLTLTLMAAHHPRVGCERWSMSLGEWRGARTCCACVVTRLWGHWRVMPFDPQYLHCVLCGEDLEP